MRHYHVSGGLPGYLPSFGATCRTLADAKSTAIDQVKLYKDQDWERGLRWTGNAKDRYWENGTDYVEITTCHEPDCMVAK